jgi:tRNA nucleotidyltransferase (CCA-adding enzyme)
MDISGRIREKISSQNLRLIERAGGLARSMGMPAYLTGGMVRDILLGKKSAKDLDITVEGDGLAFGKSLADDLQASYKGFDKFRTARIFLPDGMRIDVATARSEEYPEPGMLPVVELAAINQDLYRRDFTINAMAIRINETGFGGLIDPFGGQADLRARVLKVLHENSFKDDPTRLFRFLRFKTRLGFDGDKKTLELFRAGIAGGVFDTVSGERVREELLLVLGEKKAHEAVRELFDSGIMAVLAPGIKMDKAGAKTFDRVCAQKKSVTAYGADPMKLRLAALLAGSDNEQALGFLEKLRFSNDWKIAVSGIRQALSRLKALNKKLLPGKVHEILEGARGEALAYLEISAPGKNARENIRRYRTALKNTRLSITGTTLIEMGIKPGKICGTILKKLLIARLNSEVRTRRDEIEFVEKQLK